MAEVSGIGTTFNLPNYHGELFAVTPSDTPLLSAIGGLTGGRQTTSPRFEWQTYDLRNPKQPAVLEGANAPTATQRARANADNVCQIHQEKVEVSYTKQAAGGQYATASSAPFYSSDGEPNPVSSELDWQTEQALKQIARDVDFSFINGILNVPTSNAAARRTKGLIQACATNAVNKGTTLTGASAATDTITITHALNNGDKVVFTDVGASTAVTVGHVYYVVEKSTTVSFKVSATAGGAAITIGTATVSLNVPQTADTTVTMIEDLIQQVFDNGGLSDGLGTLLVGSTRKREISALYAALYGKAMPFAGTRNIAGVAVDQLVTDFATLNVMLSRHVPKDAIIVCSLDQLEPVFLNVPGKGVFFEEPLAKTGASDAVQIYGEVGLKFGNEKAHGVLRGLKV
jgi:hypothetical protein